jgi:hypothetical protein
LDGIGAVLIDDHSDIQATTARPDRAGGRSCCQGAKQSATETHSWMEVSTTSIQINHQQCFNLV